MSTACEVEEATEHVTVALVCTKCEGVIEENTRSFTKGLITKLLAEESETFFKYHDRNRGTHYRKIVDSTHRVC
jgi:hypothetical protein